MRICYLVEDVPGCQWTANINTLGGVQVDSANIRLVNRTRRPSGSDMKKPCACKIYGEIGNTNEEHQDECPYCEERHTTKECPTRQVTCFVCEGTTHIFHKIA